MTTKRITTTRRCVGSTRFGIEAHEADAADFPVQPSQRDGLGRMCKPHWHEYTNALRTAAAARKAGADEATLMQAAAVDAPESGVKSVAAEPERPTAQRRRRTKSDAEPAPEVEVAEAANS